MAVRPDLRLDDGPMTPVVCHACGVRVEARKASWDQTTIQWATQARTACAERQEPRLRLGPNGAAFLGCNALDESIREAAVSGLLEVQDGSAYVLNPAASEVPGPGAP